MSDSNSPVAGHHAPDVKLYLIIFGTLMVLTVVTVLVSYWHLPIHLAVLVGLAIASFKASLVAAFFMHLKGEKALIWWALVVTGFFMAVLFILPITDSRLISGRTQHIAVGAEPAGEAK
jgi:cytochrome c oxidase subunit 4